MIDALFLAGVTTGVGIGAVVFTAARHLDDVIGAGRSVSLTEDPDREFEF
ncbi:hypothetical protein [Halococcus agarilyticus]|nr:hypothetical protein [Halococcus agarilyticus]